MNKPRLLPDGDIASLAKAAMDTGHPNPARFLARTEVLNPAFDPNYTDLSGRSGLTGIKASLMADDPFDMVANAASALELDIQNYHAADQSVVGMDTLFLQGDNVRKPTKSTRHTLERIARAEKRWQSFIDETSPSEPTKQAAPEPAEPAEAKPSAPKKKAVEVKDSALNSLRPYLRAVVRDA